jgi:uncharacterized protein YoxC
MAEVCSITASGDYVCGTGDWSGPKPGDPNTSDLLLHAVPAFGGIDVTWTWPDTFPEAVAYTTIYRGLSDDFNGAAVHVAAASGNFFYDRIEYGVVTKFYYWIIVHSVYGTPSRLIGPAWANAKPRIEEMIEELTGQIDNGVLAPALKAEIARIQLNHLNITQEILDRQGEDDSLAAQITVVGAYSDDTRALLQTEVLARTTSNEAFVSTVNTLWAEVNGNIAAVQTQVTAVVNSVGALAQQITTLETEFGNDLAQVSQNMQTKIDVVDGKVVAIGALWTAQVNVNGLIGGFGVYNNGQIVEAGFDVDRFWIGRTGANKRKPFIIDSGVVYIDEAAINKLTFSKLRDESGAFIVANGKVKAQYIEVDTLVMRQGYSTNYVNNVSGWALASNGDFQINGSGGGGRMALQNNGVFGYHSNGVMAFALSV